MEEHNISPRIDEFLTLLARQTILHDNGEYGFADEDEEEVRRLFTEDESIRGCELFNYSAVCDYYMNKVGRLEEHNRWMERHGIIN